MNDILERISCHSCSDSSSYRIQSGRINVTENVKSLVNKLPYVLHSYTYSHIQRICSVTHTSSHTLRDTLRVACVKVHDASATHLPTRLHQKIRCSSHFLSIFASFFHSLRSVSERDLSHRLTGMSFPLWRHHHES